MVKPTVKISQWHVAHNRLHGISIDHPRFDPGTEVITSAIVAKPNDLKDGAIVETRNTLYKLIGPGLKQGKSKVITVILFDDGSHEIRETQNGMLVKVAAGIEAVYNATGFLDANSAIQAHQEAHNARS